MATHFQYCAPSAYHGSGGFLGALVTQNCGKHYVFSPEILSLRSVPMKSLFAHISAPSQLEFGTALGPQMCVNVRAITETLHQSRPALEGVPPAELKLVLEAARSENKLQAAATLRARSFYTYPEGRSIDALKAHQKMKADEESSTLTRKVGGMEPGYKRTTCLIACCSASDWLNVGTDLQSYCKIASSSGEFLVVGTLDINQGLVLPGELIGDHPQGRKAELCRAYLSNVCVAHECRRRGVGMTLMQHVKKVAKQWGVSDLYVHVVVENESARQLYEKAGFVYEKEESVKDARTMSRPRRCLLRAQL